MFLITDGFSNGGDPRPAANLLKDAGATIFTFGIRTGNIDELHDIASSPKDTYSYFLDSFMEFEALIRRALHRGKKNRMKNCIDNLSRYLSKYIYNKSIFIIVNSF